jgi:hypothetical protein
MFRLIGLVISIGIADSLNPSTIAPALFMASGEDARRRVTEFTIAVFAVYFLGGAAIALGPGQLLLSLIRTPTAMPGTQSRSSPASRCCSPLFCSGATVTGSPIASRR